MAPSHTAEREAALVLPRRLCTVCLLDKERGREIIGKRSSRARRGASLIDHGVFYPNQETAFLLVTPKVTVVLLRQRVR